MFISTSLSSPVLTFHHILTLQNYYHTSISSIAFPSPSLLFPLILYDHFSSYQPSPPPPLLHYVPFVTNNVSLYHIFPASAYSFPLESTIPHFLTPHCTIPSVQQPTNSSLPCTPSLDQTRRHDTTKHAGRQAGRQAIVRVRVLYEEKK